MRLLFDSTIEEFPELAVRLGPDADIVAASDFTEAIVLTENSKIIDIKVKQYKQLAALKKSSKLPNSKAATITVGLPRLNVP